MVKSVHYLVVNIVWLFGGQSLPQAAVGLVLKCLSYKCLQSSPLPLKVVCLASTSNPNKAHSYKQCWGKLLLKVMHYNIALLPKKVTSRVKSRAQEKKFNTLQQ